MKINLSMKTCPKQNTRSYSMQQLSQPVMKWTSLSISYSKKTWPRRNQKSLRIRNRKLKKKPRKKTFWINRMKVREKSMIRNLMRSVLEMFLWRQRYHTPIKRLIKVKSLASRQPKTWPRRPILRRNFLRNNKKKNPKTNPSLSTKNYWTRHRKKTLMPLLSCQSLLI